MSNTTVDFPRSLVDLVETILPRSYFTSEICRDLAITVVLRLMEIQHRHAEKSIAMPWENPTLDMVGQLEKAKLNGAV